MNKVTRAISYLVIIIMTLCVYLAYHGLMLSSLFPQWGSNPISSWHWDGFILRQHLEAGKYAHTHNLYLLKYYCKATHFVLGRVAVGKILLEKVFLSLFVTHPVCSLLCLGEQWAVQQRRARPNRSLLTSSCMSWLLALCGGCACRNSITVII